MIAQQITKETPRSLEKKGQEMLEQDYEAIQNRLLVKHDLHLASLQAFKGKAGFRRGFLYLNEASQADPNIVNNPLYQALYWEFSAYGGKNSAEVIEGALTVAQTKDSLSCYHAARALFAAGSLEAVLTVLDSVKITGFSQQLKSRYYFLLGKTHQSLGRFAKAAKALEQAAELSQELERQKIFLEIASCWLEVNQAPNALTTLASIEFQTLSKPEQANFHFIKGQLALKQGDAEAAFNELLAAQSLEDYCADTLKLYLSLAQSCILIGKAKQGFIYFEKALREAREVRSFVEHEYAFALMSEGNYLEAKTLLENILRDSFYNMHPQVLADLAEANYHLGFLTEAEEYAKEALEQGESLHSCFLLGQIACSYYQHDEAITYFEKALSETKQGDKNWLLAHTMLADTLAQQGFNEPRQIALHAKKALALVPEHDTWHSILQGYLEKATLMLGGGTKILN